MIDTVILFLVLVIVTFLVWKLWKPDPPKRPVPEGKARLYFFYTEWCGWSKKAMPHWEALEEQIKKTPYFGKTQVETVRVNAEEDRKTAELYEIEGYPSIVLETKEGLYEFTGKRTKEGLLEFLRETLGKESESL